MEQNNAPRLQLLRDPLIDGFGIVIFPVQTIHVPLDRLHTNGANSGDDMVVIFAVGTTDQGGRDACNGFHLVVAGGDIGHDLIGGEGVVVIVVVGVIHDLHPGVMESLYGLGILIHPISHQEKSGLYIVLSQRVDEDLGVLIAPRRVKGNGAVFFAVLGGTVYAVNGELAGGSGGADGGGNTYGAEYSCRCQQCAGGQSCFLWNEEHADRLVRHRDSTFLF